MKWITLTKTPFFRALLILCTLTLLTSCSSKRIIVHDLDESDANEILVFLGNNGIDASKAESTLAGGAGGGPKEVTWDISVNDPDALEAMQLLRANGLPRKRSSNLLSIFSKSGLVPSGMEEQIRYRQGLADQIGNMIRKIDGVVDADVQLTFPEENPLNPTAPKDKPTAAVYVKHTGVLDDPNSQLINKIRRLVASSVQGLDYDNVTVIPDRARFAEVPQKQMFARPQEKEYVSLWSIVIAKDSITSFRAIFFSFSLAILLLILFIVWLIWKMHPVFSKEGGMKTLFRTSPYGRSHEDVSKEQKRVEEKKEPSQEQKPPEGPGDTT